jgi:hypothetical protein
MHLTREQLPSTAKIPQRSQVVRADKQLDMSLKNPATCSLLRALKKNANMQIATMS